MSESKPMPGPCWVDVHHNVKSARGMIAFPCLSSGCDQETVAHMIAQTFNVHYTTGMTPVQLVEQRDELVERVKELEEAAKLVLDWYEAENDHSKTDFYQRMQMCRDSEDAIRSALSEARPDTAEGE